MDTVMGEEGIPGGMLLRQPRLERADIRVEGSDGARSRFCREAYDRGREGRQDQEPAKGEKGLANGFFSMLHEFLAAPMHFRSCSCTISILDGRSLAQGFLFIPLSPDAHWS